MQTVMKTVMKYVIEKRSWGLLTISVISLSLIYYPAIWDIALGGLLKSMPPQIYNAIHELRHLWGIPCH